MNGSLLDLFSSRMEQKAARARKLGGKRVNWGGHGLRFVRTPGGKTHFGEEIGEAIITDAEGGDRHLRHLRVTQDSLSQDMLRLVSPHEDRGTEYRVGQYSDGSGWFVQTSDMTNTDAVLMDGADLTEVLTELDRQHGARLKHQKPPATPKSPTLDEHKVIINPALMETLQTLREMNRTKGQKRTPLAQEKFDAEYKKQVTLAKARLLKNKIKAPIKSEPQLMAFIGSLVAGTEATDLNVSPLAIGGRSAATLTGMRRATIAELDALKVPPKYRAFQVYVPVKKGSTLQYKVWHPKPGDPNNRYKWTNVFTEAHEKAAKSDKFGRCRALSKAMASPKVVKEIADKMNDPNPKVADAAVVVMVMALFGVRVGSSQDGGYTIDKATKERIKTYGATTLEKRHYTITGNTITLNFLGKDGQPNTGSYTDPVLAAALRKRLRSLKPDERVTPGATSSNTMSFLNARIAPLAGVGHMVNKDLRTIVANRVAATTIKAILAERNGKKITTLDEFMVARDRIAKAVATSISNTPTVALGAYIDPQTLGTVGTFSDAEVAGYKKPRGKLPVTAKKEFPREGLGPDELTALDDIDPFLWYALTDNASLL